MLEGGRGGGGISRAMKGLLGKLFIISINLFFGATKKYIIFIGPNVWLVFEITTQGLCKQKDLISTDLLALKRAVAFKKAFCLRSWLGTPKS